MSLLTVHRCPNKSLKNCLDDAVTVALALSSEGAAEVDASGCRGAGNAPEVPEYLVCPISFEVFTDPVVCMDGQTYERSAIEEWLIDHDTSPLTNAKLPSKMVVPNYAIRQAIASLT